MNYWPRIEPHLPATKQQFEQAVDEMAQYFSIHCRNRCIDSIVTFFDILNYKIGSNLFTEMGYVNGEEHYWIKIDNINFDFTARQYDPTVAFPLIWEGKQHPLSTELDNIQNEQL